MFWFYLWHQLTTATSSSLIRAQTERPRQLKTHPGTQRIDLVGLQTETSAHRGISASCTASINLFCLIFLPRARPSSPQGRENRDLILHTPTGPQTDLKRTLFKWGANYVPTELDSTEHIFIKTKHVHRKYPPGFPQLPDRWLHLFPSWNSTFRTSPLCTWKWNPSSKQFQEVQRRFPRVFPVLIGKFSLQEPRAPGAGGIPRAGLSIRNAQSCSASSFCSTKAQIYEPKARSFLQGLL